MAGHRNQADAPIQSRSKDQIVEASGRACGTPHASAETFEDLAPSRARYCLPFPPPHPRAICCSPLSARHASLFAKQHRAGHYNIGFRRPHMHEGAGPGLGAALRVTAPDTRVISSKVKEIALMQLTITVESEPDPSTVAHVADGLTVIPTISPPWARGTRNRRGLSHGIARALCKLGSKGAPSGAGFTSTGSGWRKASATRGLARAC